MSKLLIPIKSNLSFFHGFSPPFFFSFSCSYPDLLLLRFLFCPFPPSSFFIHLFFSPFYSHNLPLFLTCDLLSHPPLAGLKTRAFWPIRTPSPSGLWCWVTSRGRAQRPPTGWDHSVAMETVSLCDCWDDFYYFSIFCNQFIGLCGHTSLYKCPPGSKTELSFAVCQFFCFGVFFKPK